MYINYKKVNGIEYGTAVRSIRSDGTVKKENPIYLGRVVDRKRNIFKNKKQGTFSFDIQTGTFTAVPEDYQEPEADTSAMEDFNRLVDNVLAAVIRQEKAENKIFFEFVDTHYDDFERIFSSYCSLIGSAEDRTVLEKLLKFLKKIRVRNQLII